MNTYTIYESKLTEVEKALKRIERKAQKYGVPFSYEVSEAHPQTIQTYRADDITHTIINMHRPITVSAVDITINADGFIRANGWEVIAKIEHGDEGNIVYAFRTVSEADMADWSHRKGHCDHCHSNRQRKVTYMVRHESGEVRQVGSGCLKDYTGINPATATAWAEVNDLLENGMEYIEGREGNPVPMLEVENILCHAVEAVKAHGYVRACESNSTKGEVIQRFNTGAKVTAESEKKVDSIMAWLTKEEHDPMSIEWNAVVLAKSGYCKPNHIGILSYVPVAYDKAMAKKALEAQREAQRAEQAQTSNYIGEVGNRLTIELRACELVTSWETPYGITYLYKMEDVNGNVLVWFASSSSLGDGRGVKIIKATVKAHGERDGVKQTTITRVKAVQ